MYVNQGEKKKKVKETSAKYEGIVRWIREQIEAEELQPGERIESEYQLCDRFGVSRQTVRHAIAVLEKEGMIEKRRGSGTYIKESGILGVRRKKPMQIAVMTTFVQEYIFCWYYSGNREQDVTRRIWNPDFHHQQFCRKGTFYIENAFWIRKEWMEL